MRHDWIFDVLTDLGIYAQKNGLLNVANETQRLIETARKELAEQTKAEQAGNDAPQNNKSPH